MSEIVLAFVVWLTSAHDADALRRTAPAYLDATRATEHLAASRIAGALYQLDPDLLLAMAWRESRYNAGAVTREKSGRVSCGVMMVTEPAELKSCRSRTALQGYLDGAAHLRSWTKATRSQRDALLGYAGGYRMIEACRRGPIVRERASGPVDLCSTPELRRAAWIHRKRTVVSTSQSMVW